MMAKDGRLTEASSNRNRVCGDEADGQLEVGNCEHGVRCVLLEMFE